MPKTESIISETEKWSAQNYEPLPVVLSKGEGSWVWDVDGNRYMDMLSAYSALNQGHRHPEIIKALIEQANRLTLTSRAFHNDQMGPFLKKICEITKQEKALPMNTGAEAVETAIKLARKWGYLKKKIPEDKGEIIVCANNFHGRTTTIVGFSTNPQYQDGFGPFTPGFKIIPYDAPDALKDAINERTIGFLFEPIQGEGGVIIPSNGYLREIRRITQENNCLLIADEIQTGLGRTGYLLACDYEEVQPDILILGKALGGGVYPVSCTLSSAEIMDVIEPGDHGSTFGGNPLAGAVAQASLNVLIEENLIENAREMGNYFIEKLKEIESPYIKETRGRGLLIGVEIKKEYGSARPFCEKLAKLGILAKETHIQVIRFAPPLIIKKDEIDWALKRIEQVLRG